MNIPMSYSNYVFPPVRKNKLVNDIVRLSPAQCAKAFITGVKTKGSNYSMEIHAKKYLDQLFQPTCSCSNGFHCRAGHSGFWINWKGELLPCGMFNEPKVDLLNHTFMEAWEEVSTIFRKNAFCSDCETCKKRNLCAVCLAACYTETGTTLGKPKYLCDTTDEIIRLFLNYLQPEDRKKYLIFLQE